jgi:DNA-directed RNA polymerase subunit RPC12/RpoP
MKNLKCPECGGAMTASIGPLHPMAAVAAEMLEYGAIFRCSKCMSYLSDISRVECPQCGMRSLSSSLDRDQKYGTTGNKKRTGKIACESCGWKQELH